MQGERWLTVLAGVCLVAVVCLAIAGCAAEQPEAATAPAEEQATSAPPAEQATSAPPEPSKAPEEPVMAGAMPEVDGVIQEGEYGHSADVAEGVTLWWANDGEHLYVAVEAPAAGWVAVGLDPEERMKGANYIQAAVVDGVATLWDGFGTAPTGTGHPPDEDLGGSRDIVAGEAVEDGGVTRFEAQIPLDSGDEYDKPLSPGETYTVIVAYSDSDEYAAYHTFRGGVSMQLDPVG